MHKFRTIENTTFERFLYPTTKQGLVPLPLGKGGNALVFIPASISPLNSNLNTYPLKEADLCVNFQKMFSLNEA